MEKLEQKIPISVLIPTLNAEGHLVELLESIGGDVEEVIILDSRSLDSTVDIALDRGIPIVQRAFTTHGDHFGWMLTQIPVKCDWVFLMAQDERFTPSLKQALRELFSGHPDAAGYTVRWRLWYMGRPLPIVIDNLRLMHVGDFRVADVICNEQILLEGSKGRLEGILEHKDTLTLHEWYEKQNLYSTMEAIAATLGKGQFAVPPKLLGSSLERRMFLKKIFNRVPFRYAILFIRNYFFTGAWRGGRVGLTWARMRGDVYRMREVKEREMRMTGVVPRIPKARHGEFDSRVMKSDLQKSVHPAAIEEWETSTRTRECG